MLNKEAVTKLYSVIVFSLNTEQLLLKNHIETLNFLSTDNNNIYEKKVHAKLGDNVSFKQPY